MKMNKSVVKQLAILCVCVFVISVHLLLSVSHILSNLSDVFHPVFLPLVCRKQAN